MAVRNEPFRYELCKINTHVSPCNNNGDKYIHILLNDIIANKQDQL